MKNLIFIIISIFILSSCLKQNNTIGKEILESTPVSKKIIKSSEANKQEKPSIVLESHNLVDDELIFDIEEGIKIKSSCKNIAYFGFKILYGEGFNLVKDQEGRVLNDSCSFDYQYINDFGEKVKIIISGYDGSGKGKSKIYEKDFYINFTGIEKLELNKNILSIEEQYCISKGGELEQGENEIKVCFINDGIDGIKCSLDLFYDDKCPKEIVKQESIEENKEKKLSFELKNSNEEEKFDEKNEEVISNIEDKENIELNAVYESGSIIKNIQVGKTGKYYIEESVDGYTNLVLLKNNGEQKYIFNGRMDKHITDYELMYNKQIKVFYMYGLENRGIKEEIIDLNEF